MDCSIGEMPAGRNHNSSKSNIAKRGEEIEIRYLVMNLNAYYYSMYPSSAFSLSQAFLSAIFGALELLYQKLNINIMFGRFINKFQLLRIRSWDPVYYFALSLCIYFCFFGDNKPISKKGMKLINNERKKVDRL
jgi:hypothetical protein